MPLNFSIYLDFVRFSAAMVVFLSHFSEILLPGVPLPFPGKDAVILFFVLSGFVITYVADTKERDWRAFALSRYSRLISVVLPALLLSLILTAVENHAGTATPKEMIDAVFTSVINAIFLGQIWFFDITPSNNNPIWSLNYEAIYYIIFAVIVFMRGTWRWLAALSILVIAGPKILILMPPWIAGCALYHYRDNLRLAPDAANRLFFFSAIAYAVYFFLNLNVIIRTNLQYAFPDFMAQLQWSSRFAGDYLLCLIVASNFIAAWSMDNRLTKLLVRYKFRIREASGYTLSIYLFHMPLMMAFASWIGEAHGHYMQAVLVFFLTIPSIVLLAQLTELKRAAVRSALQSLPSLFHRLIRNPARGTRMEQPVRPDRNFGGP